MKPWTPKIKRGSTFRAPLTMSDNLGAPVLFLAGQFIISPANNGDIELNQANGKLVLRTGWIWKGPWSNTVAYVPGDVVRAIDQNTNQSELWISQTSHTGIYPGSTFGLNWQLFSQFEVYLSATDTTGYAFNEAAWRLRVVEANGDVDGSLIKGLLLVTES